MKVNRIPGEYSKAVQENKYFAESEPTDFWAGFNSVLKAKADEKKSQAALIDSLVKKQTEQKESAEAQRIADKESAIKAIAAQQQKEKAEAAAKQQKLEAAVKERLEALAANREPDLSDILDQYGTKVPQSYNWSNGNV